MTLWFVTPAWKRYEMTALCLEQRQRVIAELAKHDIEAYQVVIADDENLDIARALGCATVERNNEMVGRKFNDGMEYAGTHGAEWIVPIGSDSWIDPAYFLDLPDLRYTRTSTAYCTVTADSLAELKVASGDYSAGPFVFHRRLLKHSGFRPSAEDSDMVDTSILKGIRKYAHTRRGLKLRWDMHTLHPFQYIGFRVAPMMTSNEYLKRRWLVREHEPWTTLAKHYPLDLVLRAREIMQNEPTEPLAPSGLRPIRGQRRNRLVGRPG